MVMDIRNFYVLRFLLSILFFGFFITIDCSNKVIDIRGDFVNGDFFNGDIFSSAMQLGEIALFFDHEPIINKLPELPDINGTNTSDKNNTHTSVFFLPQATISLKLHAYLDELCSKLKTPFLSFRLEKIKKPIEGLAFIISLDAGRIEVEKRVQISSLGKSEIHFNFYNKNLMQKLQGYDKGILKIS